MQYAADLCAEHEAIAGQGRRRQARRLVGEAGKLFKLSAHQRICAVAAGRQDDALAGSDKLAGTHDDAGHPFVFDRKLFNMVIGENGHVAVEQRLQELADQAQALTAHILPRALTDEIGIPARNAVDAAPGDLFLRCYEARYVVGDRDPFAPATEIEA